jgi:hypothetical protein
MDDIKIFDNIFPNWLEQIGETQFNRFSFEYNHKTLDQNKPFFGKCIYNRRTGVEIASPYFIECLADYIRTVIVPNENKTFLGFERIIINGQVHGMSPGRHTDYDHDPRYYTLVYYLLGSSGNTVFYENEQCQNPFKIVEYQKHRAVMFPSGIWHEALECNKDDWRVSIGINWLME